jgi:hypothetical protein
MPSSCSVIKKSAVLLIFVDCTCYLKYIFSSVLESSPIDVTVFIDIFHFPPSQESEAVRYVSVDYDHFL